MKNRRSHAAAIALLLALACPARAQQLLTNPQVLGHMGNAGAYNSVVQPTYANCTGASGSSDNDGSCTATSGAPAVTFATPYATAPFCLVQDSSATPAVVYTVSNTGIAITGTSAHVYYWHCAAKVGG